MLDQWHTVHIMRTGRDAIMQLDNQSRVEVLLPGGYTELSLHGDLFIGGTQSKDDVTNLLPVLENFRGCIQKVSSWFQYLLFDCFITFEEPLH